MVKARDINQDIRAIAKKVKTAVFSYDEVHNENVKNEFHYDYELVIKRVSEINGWDRDKTIKTLKTYGVLDVLPNGEYKIDVGGTTKHGGGINYHGVAFFSLSQTDYRIKYHELAHSLQKEYKLFSDEKVDKLYRSSAKGIDANKLDDKQINEIDYKLYLNEMHSECFAYTAMMLRAENPIDFLRQTYIAYNSGRMSSINGFFSFGKTEYSTDNGNSTKFYTTFPVMKEAIKAIKKIRQQGKTKDFFDENGVLKDEKLAKLCEQIVIKSAYSPRTLNALFKYRMLDNHNDNEHGWRRDTLRSLASTLYTPFITLASEKGIIGKLNNITKHNKLETEEKKKIKQMVGSRRTFDDLETQALYNYIQLNSQCSQLALKYDSNFISTDYLVAQSVGILRENKQVIHAASIRNQVRIVLDDGPMKKQKMLADEMIALRSFALNQKDNPYFCHLVEKDVDLAEVIRMYNEKLKNPEKTQIESPAPIHKYQIKHDEKTAKNYVRRAMFPIKYLTEDFKCPPAFKQALVNLALTNCETIDNPKLREAFAKSMTFKFDVFGIKKRKFEKELNKTLDKISNEVHGSRNNSAYESCKKQFEGDSLEVILAKTKDKSNDELAASYAVKRNQLKIQKLVKDFNCPESFQQTLVALSIRRPDLIDKPRVRRNLEKSVNFKFDILGLKKRKFKKQLNETLDQISNEILQQTNNAAYEPFRKQCEDLNLKEILGKTSAKSDDEMAATYAIKRNQMKIQKLVKDFDCSKSFQQMLVDLSIKRPDLIDKPRVRRNLEKSVNFKFDVLGIKKRKFKKQLNETLDKISNEVLQQTNNTAYEPTRKQYEGLSSDNVLSKISDKIKENNDVSKETSSQQANENREQAIEIVHNNLEAVNYLADRYGLADNLRTQLKKMTLMPIEKLQDKQLRKSVLGVTFIDNDLLGIEKKRFKRDFNKLMDSFIDDARFQEDNPAYAKVCKEVAQTIKFAKARSTSDNSQTNTVEKQPDATLKKEAPIAEIEIPSTEKIMEKLKTFRIGEDVKTNETPKETKSQQAEFISLSEKNGAQKVCDMLQQISEVADKNDASGKLKEKLVKAYIEDDEQMLSLKFWGDCVKEFEANGLKRQDTLIQELGRLGLKIGKDIRLNKDNAQYQAVKKHCAQKKDCAEIIQAATACAKRSDTTIGMSGSVDKAADRR